MVAETIGPDGRRRLPLRSRTLPPNSLASSVLPCHALPTGDRAADADASRRAGALASVLRALDMTRQPCGQLKAIVAADRTTERMPDAAITGPLPSISMTRPKLRDVTTTSQTAPSGRTSPHKLRQLMGEHGFAGNVQRWDLPITASAGRTPRGSQQGSRRAVGPMPRRLGCCKRQCVAADGQHEAKGPLLASCLLPNETTTRPLLRPAGQCSGQRARQSEAKVYRIECMTSSAPFCVRRSPDIPNCRAYCRTAASVPGPQAPSTRFW